MNENKVNSKIETIGFYKKNRDRTAVPGVKPARLNEKVSLNRKLGERSQMDLTLGTEGFVDEGDGDIFHSIFDYLKQTHPKGSSLQEAIGAEFFTNRRNLKLLAMSAHYVARTVEFKAVRKHGVIFLSETSNSSDFYADPWPYGFKFEQYMTLDENGKAHEKTARVSNAECTKAVFRTTLSSEIEKISVFYAAELDATDSKGRFIEMKTSGHDYSYWLNTKSLGDFAQSFFGNIYSIFYGYTVTQTHMVYQVDPWRPNEIHEEARKHLVGTRFAWNWEKCLEELFSILQEIKGRLENDDKAITVRVTKQGISYEPADEDKCDFVDPMFLRHFE